MSTSSLTTSASTATTRKALSSSSSSGMKSRSRPIRPKLKNSVFRLKTAHHFPFTNKELAENSRGILKGKLQSTLAQIPSIYYYLSQRCGIGYKEAEDLVSSQRLVFGGTEEANYTDVEHVTNIDQLKMQLPFEAVEDLGIKIHVPSKHQLIPVEKRQYHRQYFASYFRRPTKFANDPVEPRSFVYTIPGDLTMNLGSGAGGNPEDVAENEKAAEGKSTNKMKSNSSTNSSVIANGCVKYNVLLPPGCRDVYCYGFGIITNDLAMMPFFTNENSGNFGIYRVWFEPGVPDGEVAEIAKILDGMLSSSSSTEDGDDDTGSSSSWAFLDADTRKSVPQFAFASKGAYFPNRRVVKKVAETRNPGKKEIRNCIWLSTPALPKSWVLNLLVLGVRTTGIEHVQMNHEFRFLHPEIDEYMSLSPSDEGRFADMLKQKSSSRSNDDDNTTSDKISKSIEAFQIEKESWTQLDQKLEQFKMTSPNKKKLIDLPLHVISPGRRSVDWLGHFNPSEVTNKSWFEPLSENAIESLHQVEHRFKVNNIVRSLRDACAE